MLSSNHNAQRNSSQRLTIVQALPGQSTPEGVPAFKLVLVGDGGTGATALTVPATYPCSGHAWASGTRCWNQMGCDR